MGVLQVPNKYLNEYWDSDTAFRPTFHGAAEMACLALQQSLGVSRHVCGFFPGRFSIVLHSYAYCTTHRALLIVKS